MTTDPLLATEQGPRPTRPAGVHEAVGIRIETARAVKAPTVWLYCFVGLLILAQVALLFLGNTSLRLPLRVGAYAVGLVLCVLIRKPIKSAHPAMRASGWVFGCLLCGLLFTQWSDRLAAVGQIALYLAVLSPLYWVSRVPPSPRTFRRLLLIMCAFQIAGACAVVLQVQFPGHFRGAVSTAVLQDTNVRQGAMTISLANGMRMLRPTGLTDTPGGASLAGLYAIVFGLGLFVSEKSKIIRVALIGGMISGVFCVIMSQNRVFVVMSLICALGFCTTIARRREWGRLFQLPVLIAFVVLVGATWALTLGGEGTMARLSTLTEDDPRAVFYKNRGHFFTEMITEDLPRFPLGAGLGRWGLMNTYFGDPDTSLWSEMMWTSWLYDGGIELIIAYLAILIIATRRSWEIAADPSGGEVTVWAAMIFSCNLAALAATFVFPIFSLQAGMEIWFLNACLWGAWKYRERSRPQSASQFEYESAPSRNGGTAVPARN